MEDTKESLQAQVNDLTEKLQNCEARLDAITAFLKHQHPDFPDAPDAPAKAPAKAPKSAKAKARADDSEEERPKAKGKRAAKPAPDSSESGEEAPARAGGKKKKDPNAPKLPPSAYMLFAKEERGRVHASNPGMSFGELSKAVGTAWKNTSEEEKRPYFVMQEEAHARYLQEKAIYEKNHL
eukprot:TRINITY_DN17519_c0_g1_i1.p1 TRINITY_DN17519_c0_g1~~TRINITY_DN17519_c0_g1_i1.p1  ORF type:complete len:181 (+),score=39.98 TRINITY_DN17519_c0_g1_i1:18-560(+)